MLHLVKTSAAAFAKGIALAGRTNRNAGRVRGGVVPDPPGGHGLGRKAGLVSLFFMVENQQGIDLGQRAQFRPQGDTVRRRCALTPVVDSRFDVSDVDAGHEIAKK